MSDSKNVTNPKFVIKCYGFKIINGSTNGTAAEWVMKFRSCPDRKITMSFPKVSPINYPIEYRASALNLVLTAITNALFLFLNVSVFKMCMLSSWCISMVRCVKDKLLVTRCIAKGYISFRLPKLRLIHSYSYVN